MLHEPVKALKPLPMLDLPKIPGKGREQTLQEWHAAGGSVPVQYKSKPHVWHAKVKKYAEGGSVAASIDGNEFVKAAQAVGLKTDTATLNKIVIRVNKGESIQEAARAVAQGHAEGGPVGGEAYGNAPDSSDGGAVQDAQHFVGGGAVRLAGGGRLGSFPSGRGPMTAGQPKRREASITEAVTQGLLPMLYGAAKGTASHVGGMAGDLESLAREGLNFSFGPGGVNLSEETFLPTSNDVRGYLPSLKRFGPTVAGVEDIGADLGQNLVGMMFDPTAFRGAIKGAKAVGRGALDLAKSEGARNVVEKVMASPLMAPSRQMNVVKDTGGNWLGGSVEKGLSSLKARTVAGETPAQRMSRHEELLKDPSLSQEQVDLVRRKLDQTKGEAALDKWVDSNLTNYVKKQMGTPEDPVRKLAEEGVTHVPNAAQALDYESIFKQRRDAGFPQKGMGQSPAAKAWEQASDEAISTRQAGKIQGAPAQLELIKELDNKVDEARRSLDKKFADRVRENTDLDEEQINRLVRSTPVTSKATAVGDTKLDEALNAQYVGYSPKTEALAREGRENPWISKLDPKTPIHSTYADDLGFDHILDVLREDVTAGRIRPEQLNKVSMEQAVRRTYEYDQELAKAADAARAKTMEGMPVYKAYPEGYRWVQLDQPGQFAQESNVMGHSVRGYEPPKGHPDYTPESGDSGSEYYGHGGYEGIKSGKAKIYSLRDPKGTSHATIEVKAKNAGWQDFRDAGDDANDANAAMQAAKLRMGITPGNESSFLKNMDGNQRYAAQQELNKHMTDIYKEKYGKELPGEITQIKGKSNAAPNKEYLPYVQDFVKSGNWSGVGDPQNAGLRRYSDVFNINEQRAIEATGQTVPSHEYLTGEEIQRLHNAIVPEGKRLKYDAKGSIIASEPGYKAGGEVHMQAGGVLTALGAFKKLGKAGAKLSAKELQAVKEAKALAEAPKGVEPIVVKKAVESQPSAPTQPMYAAPKAPQAEALLLAKQRAKNIGQSENPRTRMLQQGYEDDWYHGGTGNISRFRSDLLGETTGAQSAKKGFFFARDPQDPPKEMLKKSNDPTAGDLLRKMGRSEEYIAKLNTVSMEGHGAETASGYALIGGSREYKEAMRKAKAAEKRKNWPEYEKQMQIAEESETKRMQHGQGLVAKYGDARDEMLEDIKNVWYGPQNSGRFKNMSQADYEAYDKKFKEIMPYGWYNSYGNPQLEALKKELMETVGKDAAKKAVDKIDKFQSVRNERVLAENTQEGGNVMPVALRYEKPMVYDFEGKPYRDQSYSDLVDQALMSGNDALILKNTYDPGGGPSKLVDVGVVFDPDQIRSRFAAFDPLRKTAATAAAAGLAAPNLLAEENKKARGGLSLIK